MLKIGNIIANRKIIAITNQFVLAECIEDSPEPYTVWRLDYDMNGVHSGRYFKEKMDAEWEFCSLVFPWFQDNVVISDPNENAFEGQAQEQNKQVGIYSKQICINSNISLEKKAALFQARIEKMSNVEFLKWAIQVFNQ